MRQDEAIEGIIYLRDRGVVLCAFDGSGQRTHQWAARGY